MVPTSRYARDILLLIGMRKFCRHIVASAPGTAMAFFIEMTKQKKYHIPIGQFASNISTEAILNKDLIYITRTKAFIPATLDMCGHLRRQFTATSHWWRLSQEEIRHSTSLIT